MDDKEYVLRYLPLFEQELTAVRDYISRVLMNPTSKRSFLRIHYRR
jgi:hypothetical protein